MARETGISPDLFSDFFSGNSDKKNTFIIKSLDALQNALSIYDRNGSLLFGNKAFCKNFAIKDLPAVVGKSIQEIASNNNIEVTATGISTNNWRMFEVLESGKEILNWEVRLDRKDTDIMPLFISNDMYPILDVHGKVQGMIEIARHREQDIKLVRNVMGLTADYTFSDIIGDSPAILSCIDTAKKYAYSPFSILITGESGVGKELFAQSIHNYSPRRKGPFVALNCAALPENLIESELFGYVSGAFTGASKNGKPGKFELANGGTLFLDEIGELPLHFQSKLLRVLETWTVTRVGGTKPIPVNVRLIAATNRDLAKMAADNTFRQDLYYRIQVLNVQVPSLRERKEDLTTLSTHFLKTSSLSEEESLKTLSPAAEKALLAYDWPGNVRELKNVISRVSVLSKAPIITASELNESIGISPAAVSDSHKVSQYGVPPQSGNLDEIRGRIDGAYADLLREALRQTGGNKSKAADLLDISRKTFYRMLEKYIPDGTNERL